MYIDFEYSKNVKTSWGEKLSICGGFQPSIPDELDIFIKTKTIDVSFSLFMEYSEQFLEKLEFYLLLDKEFLLSLNEREFHSEKDFNFPSNSNEKSLMIAKNVKKFIARGSKNKFSDYAGLKTFGRDKYSSMRINVLRNKINPNSLTIVENTDFNDKHKATTYRWIMRGLPVDMAIHKVKVDLEISNNIINKYKKN